MQNLLKITGKSSFMGKKSSFKGKNRVLGFWAKSSFPRNAKKSLVERCSLKLPHLNITLWFPAEPNCRCESIRNWGYQICPWGSGSTYPEVARSKRWGLFCVPWQCLHSWQEWHRRGLASLEVSIATSWGQRSSHPIEACIFLPQPPFSMVLS